MCEIPLPVIHNTLKSPIQDTPSQAIKLLITQLYLEQCSNYIYILDLTPGFNRLHKDNFKTRRQTFKFGDLVRLILEIFLNHGMAKVVRIHSSRRHEQSRQDISNNSFDLILQIHCPESIIISNQYVGPGQHGRCFADDVSKHFYGNKCLQFYWFLHANV